MAKVSWSTGSSDACCCAGPPGECCMYPAQALIDGLYTVADLPDEVLFNDGSRPPTILQKTLNPELIGGVGYLWPQDGSDDAGIYFIVVNDGSDPITWAFGDDRGEGSFPCLIQGDGNLTPNNDLSEDQFADTYTVNANLEYPWEEQGSPITIPVNGSFTLERFSLCQWRSSGFPSNAPFFVLNYVNLPPSENPILNEGPQWSLQIYFLEYDPGLFVSSVNFKGDPQNSPVGSYGTGFYGTASIS